MGSKSKYIFDTETDGLVEDATTIHSLVLKDITNGTVFSYSDNEDYEDIDVGLTKLFKADLIIGFNSVRFDIPVIFRLYPRFASIIF